MKKKWKWIMGAAIALAILGALGAQGLRPLKLELLEIKKRTISQTFTEEGLVAPETEYPISTLSGGKVVRIHVVEGQEVKKGTLLMEIDSTDLASQAKQLRAQLKSVTGEETKTLKDTYPAELTRQKTAVEQAKGDLETARKNFDRISTLYEAGAVSSVEYESAQKALKDAENKVAAEKAALEALLAQHKPQGGTVQYYSGLKEALEAQLDQINYRIAQCTIEAPSDGTIAGLSVKEGEILGPNSQVMTVLPEGMLKIEVFVLTEDVDDLRPGMEVSLIQDKLDEDIVFSGTISAIAPSAVEKTSALGLEEQRVKVTILPDIPKSMTLRPGYALDVKFKTAEETGRLVVPKTALFPYKNGDALWVVRKGKAAIRPVSTGFENETEIAITEGLQEGDLVILDPQAEGLKEGKRVTQKK